MKNMKVEVNFVNETSVDLKQYYALAKKLICYADKYLKLPDKEAELTYIFIDDTKMQYLNKTYRHIDKTTDVLTFNSDIEGYLADIFISFSEAKRQSVEFDHNLEIEMAYLFTHGFLHSLGYDHKEHDVDCEMFDIQDNIVEEVCKK